METHPLDALRDGIVGRRCTIERMEGAVWRWVFGKGGEHCAIVVSTPWRIVADGAVAYGADDDGHKFGLPSPVDGEAASNALLRSKPALSVAVDRDTADLEVTFEGGTRLELFNSSVGYEGWQAFVVHEGQAMEIIGGGGGAMSFIRYPAGERPSVAAVLPLPPR